jgi:3-oxoacyl-[acyl-carrier protein] reductase
VQPGPTDTEMNPSHLNVNPGAAASVAQMAIGRYAKPEEVAVMVTFLASEHGRAVTGQTINVDGGWTA